MAELECDETWVGVCHCNYVSGKPKGLTTIAKLPLYLNHPFKHCMSCHFFKYYFVHIDNLQWIQHTVSLDYSPKYRADTKVGSWKMVLISFFRVCVKQYNYLTTCMGNYYQD